MQDTLEEARMAGVNGSPRIWPWCEAKKHPYFAAKIALTKCDFGLKTDRKDKRDNKSTTINSKEYQISIRVNFLRSGSS
jgi:hypothetical protein